MHCKTCGKSRLNLEFRQISYLLKNVFLSVYTWTRENKQRKLRYWATYAKLKNNDVAFCHEGTQALSIPNTQLSQLQSRNNIPT